MYKNLLSMANQLNENKINCKRSYSFFQASNAYDMALIMEKNRNKLDDKTRELLKLYREIMKKIRYHIFFQVIVW